MKNIMLVILFCFLLASNTLAAPFLVCSIPPEDDKEIISYYELSGLSGVLMRIQPENVAYGFKHDIGTLPVQTYTIVGKACSDQGCSDASKPFIFKNDVPTTPVNLRGVQIENVNYVVSDPAAATDCLLRYQVTEKNKRVNVPLDPTGTYGLKYNVSKLSNGTHVLSIRAQNPWGFSEPVEYVVIKKNPGSINISIVP